MITSNYIATLTLKYILEEGKLLKGENLSMETLTDDEFLQEYIPLACYWSNDMIDLCFRQLGVEQLPDMESTVESINAWYAWFEKTVEDKWAIVSEISE